MTTLAPQPLADNAFANLLQANYRLAPSAEFAAAAVAQPGIYEEADADRPAFWVEQAHELLTWEQEFETALDFSGVPFAKWFIGSTLNAAYKAPDRHGRERRPDTAACNVKTRTYRLELLDRGCHGSRERSR